MYSVRDGKQQEEFDQGLSEFVFPNGDRYLGAFWAHRSGLVWREGHGVYMTHDGHIYEGEWKDDRLDENEHLIIVYPQSDSFIGKLAKFKYTGPGCYEFNKRGRLICNFHENKPEGDVVFIDHHNQCWYGRAEAERAILFKEHVFYAELDENRGKGARKFPEPLPPEGPEGEAGPPIIDLKELERQTFAKSTKTLSNINFGESNWVKDYEQFKRMCHIVLPKVHWHLHLDEEEYEWYLQYLKSVKILERRKNRKLKKPNCELLKKFYTEAYWNSCPPVRVLYPTQFHGEQ